MVGKIRHGRQKLHQEAVKLDWPGRPPPPLFGLEPAAVPPHAGRTGEAPRGARQVLTESSFPSAIFVGTKITPENLVQTLTFEEPPAVPTPVKKVTEPEDKKTRTKKEKMKDRRERWLSKISSIKQAKERERAAAQRQATPVVGDMRPLADALPELCQLIGPPAAAAGAAPASRRQSRKSKPPMRRPLPTDFSQMRHSQKRKLLEAENSRFSQTVKELHAKTNPLVDIGEQLRKRMKEEEEQGPS